MRFFTQSVTNYVIKLAARIIGAGEESHNLILMIPAMQENAVVACAEAITSAILKQTSSFVLKVAPILTDGWSEQHLEQARSRDWLVENGSLTSYRNKPSKITVLIGSDKVTDSSSLEDFHVCDFDSIWKNELQCSFASWVLLKLQEADIGVISMEDAKSFDGFIRPLYICGRADLIQISKWLEQIDLSVDGEDLRGIKRTILRSFDYFKLPLFTGFLKSRKADLGHYIEKASAFFNYTMFLDERNRNRALKAVATIREGLNSSEEINLPLDDEEVRGDYETPIELIEGLDRYIADRSPEDREKLLKCDFVTVFDKILKFKKTVTREKNSTTKLTGSPVEVVLTAIWHSLQGVGQNKGTSTDTVVERIIVNGEIFKHDLVIDAEDDTALAIDNETFAREYLGRLIGGIDAILSGRIALKNNHNEDIKVDFSFFNDQINCKHSRSAEPNLEFSVNIVFKGSEQPQKRKFAWRLPEHHPYRIAESFVKQASRLVEECNSTYCLPVYHVPYYEEVMRASSDEELRRVLLHCVQDARLGEIFVENLLHNDWLSTGDQLLESFKKLSVVYNSFVRRCATDGLFAAMLDDSGRTDQWSKLFKIYETTFDESIEKFHSSCAPMLLRAFSIIARRESFQGDSWFALPYESSLLISVLHPALLELIEAQVIFQVSCFNAAVNNEFTKDTLKKAFSLTTWRTYLDFSSLQAPLAGILCDDQLRLDTNTRGKDLFHRIGLTQNNDAPLSTRVLLSYSEETSEAGLTDLEMFKETSESRLLLRLILDYFRLHPHARDGISIAVFRNKDIQPIIAALHKYLLTMADPKEKRYFIANRQRPYAISVTFFTESCDDTDINRWIEEWRQRWEAAETETKYRAYTNCRFSVAHRLVERNNLKTFQSLIRDSLEADIAVFYGFVSAGGGVNRFDTVEPFDITTRTLKFPILEKACCSIQSPTDQFRRSRVISNRQFSLGGKHAGLMHCLKSESLKQGTIVIGTGDFAPWRGVIDALHQKTEWVICIDPNVDDRLLREPNSGEVKEREIIGFGSGVGTHGEDNYTISTEQFSFADLNARLSASIRPLFCSSEWNQQICSEISAGVLRVACKLSGLSLVRATGVDDRYIHDFMAYALSRKLIKAEPEAICDSIVSLDAYRHWFDLESNQRRPDLMWLTAKIGDDKRLNLEIHLIECKLGLESEDLLLNARAQINNGLRVLMKAFAPVDHEPGTNMDDSYPERRYWWMQLHRLVASQSEVSGIRRQQILQSLEQLAEGDFSITWKASIFAFWTNGNASGIERAGYWQTGLNNDVNAQVFFMRSNFIKDLATGNSFPRCWQEVEEYATVSHGNICEYWADVDLPPFDADDDDPFELNEIDSDDEEEDSEIENLDISQTPSPFDNSEISKDPAPGDEMDSIDDGKLLDPVNSAINEIDESIELPENDDFEPGENNEAFIGSETIGGAEESFQKIPERILLGSSAMGNKPIYWEFGHKDLANRHLVIFGTAGYGKSYAIQCLLCELARAGQNSLIVDYTDGFIPSKIERPATIYIKDEAQTFVRNCPLPINPFNRLTVQEAGLTFTDSDETVANRIASIFKGVYALGQQQFSVLVDAIVCGLSTNGEAFDLVGLLKILESYAEDGIHPKLPVQTVLQKLKSFVGCKPFDSKNRDVGWAKIFSDENYRSKVFQFFMVDREHYRAITEFVLWDFYAFVVAHGNKQKPKVVVLDEIQNLDLDENAPAAKYFIEGRKHGIALIAATQNLRQVGGVNDARVSRMFQADLKLFFKPAETEIKEHAQLLQQVIPNCSVAEWKTRLSNLQKGECWALGRFRKENSDKLAVQAHRVKITSLEERGFNGQ